MSGTGIAQFSYPTWIARYPEFSGLVSSPAAQAYWNEATLYCDNTGLGPVTDAGTLGVLLNMVTAHIAALNSPTLAGGTATPLVGRISDASEGSVHVVAEYVAPKTGSEAWFNQTKYGAAFWAATAQYRRFQYTAGPKRFLGVFGYGQW